MRPDDLQSWMLAVAKAAAGDPHSFVFVMRDCFTKAYQAGVEAGLHGAGRDDFVRHQIEQMKTERQATDA